MHNLKDAKLSQLIDFIFAHPPDDDRWMTRKEWEYSIGRPSELIAGITDFFARTNQDDLFTRFDRRQLVHGFQFVVGPWGFWRFVTHDDVDFEVGAGCVKTIPTLFDAVFARDPLQPVCLMWFESILAWPCGVRRNLGADAQLRSVLEDAIEDILLNSTAEPCIKSALHGVNHLHYYDHAWCEAEIDRFLLRHSEEASALHEFALNCRTGRVL